MLRFRPVQILAVAVSATELAACGASAASTGARRPVPISSRAAPAAGTRTPAPACGTRAPEALATATGMVATRIYAGELSGTETRSDQRQVEGFAPLQSALAAGNREALKAAVTTLVYSHTHVVRLRVTRGARVLADVGGPYILAPVSGTLRAHGRVLGHYVLSVQDDLGYIKLVTRFLAVPLVLRVGSHQIPVTGQLAPAPASIPNHGPLSYRGKTYEAFSFAARSFPGGPLRISLLVPPAGGLAARSCAQIRSAALAHAAQLISRRFRLGPSSFAVYIEFVRTLTDGLLYVRSGARQLAGTTTPGPARLPTSGAVTYRGHSYAVSSFTAPSSSGRVRIYQLVRG
ncbi:MAG TPA: hypothetical protein VGN13_02455 [Solirubrobacteraceae bacterium]|jgi:hypothetical protein